MCSQRCFFIKSSTNNKQPPPPPPPPFKGEVAIGCFGFFPRLQRETRKANTFAQRANIHHSQIISTSRKESARHSALDAPGVPDSRLTKLREGQHCCYYYYALCLLFWVVGTNGGDDQASFFSKQKTARLKDENNCGGHAQCARNSCCIPTMSPIRNSSTKPC